MNLNWVSQTNDTALVKEAALPTATISKIQQAHTEAVSINKLHCRSAANVYILEWEALWKCNVRNAQPSTNKCIWSALLWHLWCDLFGCPGSIYSQHHSTTCSGSQIREDTVASPSQAELSDNRWDLECLPVLSKQEECVHACMCCSVYCIWWRTPAGRVLPTPYETCWRMITMESDYHLVSHLSLCPLPLPPPLFCFSLLSHSAREVKCHPVSVVKAANHPHSECKATVAKETVIRLLGTWSCAHNSHFVAWKHTYMHAHKLLTK